MPYKLEPIGHGRALACYTYYPSKMDEWSDDESDFSDSDDSDLDSSEDEETELNSSQSATDNEVQSRDDKRPIDQVAERGDVQEETCKKFRRLDSQNSDAQTAAGK